MKAKVSSPCCERMKDAISLKSIIYNKKFREHGISIPDGGSSSLLLDFCPWCSKRLPSSLREKWFAHAERLQVPAPYDAMPQKFQSDAWWKNDDI